MATSVVPSVSRVAAKWARRAASASGEYEEGVRSTTRSWAAASAAGEANYKTAVTAAAGAGRYGKGVQRSGDTKWKKNTVEKGPMRFAQGVQVGEADYSSQIAPYLDVISKTDLPARGPKGAEANYNRSATIGKALRAFSQSR
jgi:hypothetical protein